MNRRLLFYLKHSLRSLQREPRRSLFAAFAIGVGVAAIVGLQSLGLSINAAVTRDVQATHQADIVVTPHDDLFTPEERDALDALAAQGRFVDWTWFVVANPERPSFIAPTEGLSLASLQWLQPYLVEPDKYPLYGEIRAIEPKDVPLSQLLTSPGDVVLSKDIAGRLGLGVGDEVVLENSDTFVVTGIVRNEATGGPFAPYFVPPMPWFGYLSFHDTRAREVFILEEGDASLLFIKTRDEADSRALAGELEALSESLDIETSEERLPEIEDIADAMGKFILTAGLVSLVIGGIGILNTMLVVVGRRTLEVAVLKTMGLKGRQVTLLFLTEGVMLGVVGSIVGILLGLLLSYGLTGFAERFLLADLAWSLHVEPIYTGLVVGVIATTIFGFLPTLAASRVRPNAVLQPQASVMPRTGRLLSFAVVVLLTAVMGLVASVLLGSLLIGMLGAYGVLVLFVLLTVVLLGIVWLVGRLPSFGSINIKLSLRGLSRQRGRAASTLLALIVGLFAMSFIVILGGAMTQFIDEILEDELGGNIFMFLLDPNAQLREKVSQQISALPEVTNAVESQTFRVEQLFVNGRPIEGEELQAFLNWRDHLELLLLSETPEYGRLEIGRNLGPEDVGSPVVLARSYVPWLHEGDQLTLVIGGQEVHLELVGIPAWTRFAGWFSEEARVNFVAPLGAIDPSLLPETALFVLEVSDDEASAVTAQLNRNVPGAIAIQTVTISSVFKEVFHRVTILPSILSGLALFTGAVIIANSVALATMERRREIAMMKAVGARGSRVLTALLLENALLGLVAGAIAVAMSLGFLGLFNRVAPDVSATPDPISVLAVLAVAIAVALGAAVLSAWPASRERPLNVLRYE